MPFIYEDIMLQTIKKHSCIARGIATLFLIFLGFQLATTCSVYGETRKGALHLARHPFGHDRRDCGAGGGRALRGGM